MFLWLKRIKPLIYLAAFLLILSALLVSIGRMSTPYLNKHLPDFEAWSSEILKTPVKIHQVHITWNLFEPELSFNQVTLLDKKTGQPEFSIKKIKVNLSLFRSLWHWQPIPESIQVSGTQFTVQRHGDQYQIKEFKEFVQQDTASPAAAMQEIAGVILTPAELILKNINITYIENNVTRTVLIKNLILLNSGSKHQMECDAVIHDIETTRVHAKMELQGDVTDLSHLSADISVYAEGIPLQSWLTGRSWQHLAINQGLVSAKVTARWDRNQFQKIQSDLQVYDLELESLLTHYKQKIPRLEAHLGWKREGENQVFYGEDVLIDFPSELWPGTYFSVTAASNTQGGYLLKKLNIGYVNLKDVKKLAVESGLLSEENKKYLNALDPKGELRRIQLDVNNAFSTELNNVSFSAWESFPAIRHVSGLFVWKENQADLNLNSSQFTLIYPKLFLKPLQFDQLKGNVVWHKQKNDWTLQGKNIKAKNADVNGLVNFSLKKTSAHLSPFMDLSGHFAVTQAANISRYLPLGIFSEHLQTWLKHAFLKGQIESANVIVHGLLNDFPFEKKNSGHFLINGQVKNLNLNYAPGWPVLVNLQGQLIFSGSSMTANIQSGKTLDIPLSSVTAAIPYLGSNGPSILQVKGLVQADASKGLAFIHKSPLQSSLGKDLAGMDITGPMQLKLNLTVPLGDTDKTQVAGDLTLQNGTLDLHEWDLLINQINGLFHFTENDFKASNVKAKVFDEDLTLNFITQHPSAGPYIQADLQTAMTVEELQNWVHFPLEKYAQGRLPFHLELHLGSEEHNQSTEVFLKSDLQGISLNLPGPYAKKADEKRNLSFSLNIPPNKPLKAYVSYGDDLSAALVFEKIAHGVKFHAGELRLGGEKAEIPKQPGLMIFFRSKNLDETVLKPYQEWTQNLLTEHASPGEQDSVFRGIDLQTDKAEFLGQRLDKAHIVAIKKEEEWLADINSTQVAGRLTAAADFSELEGKFQKIYLNSSKQSSDPVDPKSIPALNLSVNELRYDNKNIGAVTLVTVPVSNGMQIKQLQINSSALNLRATGSWIKKQLQETRLQGQIYSPLPNQFLNQWGMNTSSLIVGRASSQFDLFWSAAPYQPDLKSLSGGITLDLRHGRVVNLGGATEAKIGLGRVLSVLSLQTIPRRLSLDFSDLFQNGYSFDYMQGSFKLDNGHAYTTNTRFEGPVARIDIAGRIGLTTKDYNLKLGVTTYVSSSLVPAAVAALSPYAILNPYVAVATWAVGALLTQPSKVTSYQYRIVGPWDNPEWDKIG